MIHILVFAAGFPAAAIVVRDDVAPNRYLASESDYPAVFGIYRGPSGQPDCLATLVAPRWALTAAHCTQDAPLLEALSTESRYEVTVAGIPHAIDRVVRHPSWNGDVEGDSFDLALVRLAEAEKNTRPVPLGRAFDEIGQTVVMVGWGDHGTGLTGPQQPDGRFRRAENRIEGADDHWLWWDFSKPGEGGGALPLEGISGPGDSGGPAFVAGKSGDLLVGISSSQVTGGGPEGIYGVTEYYSRVSKAIDWIDSVISADSRTCETMPAPSVDPER